MSAHTPSQLTHGHRQGSNGKKSPTYVSWDSMLARCLRSSHPYFEDYGGRGVQVDPRWRGPGGFERFLEDMGERPDDMTLDRIDVDGHYTKANCRWATTIEQRWNRRDMMNPAQRRDDVLEPLFGDSGSEDARPRHRIIGWDEEDEIPL